MLKVAVLGAAGRMGRAVLSCIFEADDLKLVGAVTETGDAQLGRDAGELGGGPSAGVPLTDERSQGSARGAGRRRFHLAGRHRSQPARLRRARRGDRHRHDGPRATAPAKRWRRLRTRYPIVYGRNLSVGVNVFMELVARAAKALGDGYDVEIAETHHRHKVDAPSGTALALGERIAGTRGRKLDELAVYARHGQTGPRVPGTIGFSVARGGNVVGEHAVRFIGAEEEVEFFHRAADRKTFARGALRAARWAAGSGAGLVLDGRRARTVARLKSAGACAAAGFVRRQTGRSFPKGRATIAA